MKPLTFQLLRLLSNGEFHSGEILARGLGLSRASVCNALKNLDQAGLEIHKVRGRGYRLGSAISLLDEGVIRNHLAKHSKFFALEILDTVTSTNTFILDKAAHGAPHASVAVTEWQTEGRGRHGRFWYSGIGDGITFSLLWRFDQGASALSGLSLAVSVAIVRALQSFGVEGAQVKWPNDVLWQYRKLAGILIELSGDALGPSTAIIGIGLNVKLAEATRSSIEQAAVDLFEIGSEIDRNALLARLLIELKIVLETFSQRGFSNLREEWLSLHVLQDKEVKLQLPDGTLESGIVQGVDDNGSLILQVGTQVKHYHSGEVSLSTKRLRSGIKV